MKKKYISISNSRYAEITRKKGNIHFNVNFMPLYDINDSRIFDKFTNILMCQQINISIKNIATHYSNLKVIFLSTYF